MTMPHLNPHPIKPGRQLMLGNEAIAKAAWQKGLNLFAAYAGTPSTEIGETISDFAGLYGEWSVNEAVSAGVAQGAAYVGAASMIAMKHVGANVASDYLNNIARTRMTKGGAFLVVVADDPGMHSSQNAQDSRFMLAYMADIPILSAADSQTAWDLTRFGLELSKEFSYPVALWITTRVAHTMSVVDVPAELASRRDNIITHLQEEPHFKAIPSRALSSNRQVITEFMPRFAEVAEVSPYNRMEIKSKALGVISTGVACCYAREVFPDASHLELGMLFPLPKKMIQKFASSVREVIVLEEGARFLENEVRMLGIPCRGKEAPWTGEELEPQSIRRYFLGGGTTREKLDIPSRPPILCPGCPHAAVYEALHQIDRKRKKAHLPKMNRAGDIGCYSLGEMQTLSCMGASINHMHGMVSALEQKWYSAPIEGIDPAKLGPMSERFLLRYEDGVLSFKGHITRPEHDGEWRRFKGRIKSQAARQAVQELWDKANDEICSNWALIGDSTLFHSGSPGILNITHNGGRGTVLVFNNSYTAMTGGQDHPGTDKMLHGERTHPLALTRFARGLGVKADNVKVVDPFQLEETIQTLQKEMGKRELSVVITNRPCVRERELFHPGEPYHVDAERCLGCGICYDLNCPAISNVDGKASIRADLCTGCSLCGQLCPDKFGAITKGRGDAALSVKCVPARTSVFSTPRIGEWPVTNILVAGVGGQGVITASAIISEVALRHLGYATKADVHGMSQLGGEVNSHVRISTVPVQSPLIPVGEADVLLGFEPMEAARWAHMLRPDGVLLTSTNEIPSGPMARGRMAYPEDALDRLAASKTNVLALDAWSVASSLGDARVVNSFMIGALSKLLPLPDKAWTDALTARFKRGLELNLKAFELGREAVRLPGGLGQAPVAAR